MSPPPAFDPYRLGPEASLNRVTIVDLPGVAMDASARGKSAFDLLGAHALSGALQERAADLALPVDDAHTAATLPMRFERCFAADNPNVRLAAEQVAEGFGRRLATLVLTLKRGDTVNRSARPDWTGAHWAYWAGIRHIWLGGGWLSGNLGPRLVSHAQAFIAAAGIADCALHLSPYAANLPLIGAARCAPAGTQAALVFDFGSSRVKRGLAVYENNALALLRPLAPRAAEWTASDVDPAIRPANLAQFMVTVMAGAWGAARQQGFALAPVIVASVASYIADGQPPLYERGAYAGLRVLSDNLAAWLSHRVSERLGQAIAVQLVHDGTAAAKACAEACAEAQSAAVITLGTAIGVGFPAGAVPRRWVPAPETPRRHHRGKARHADPDHVPEQPGLGTPSAR